MSIGTRIEERRKALGIGRAELARRADMPLTSLVSLINRGSRKSAHLVKIAQALETTPGFLSGESENPQSEFSDTTLTSEERNWLDWLRAAAPADRKALAQLAKTIANGASSPSVHDNQQTYRATG